MTEITLNLPAGEFLVTARVNLLTRATWTGQKGAPVMRPFPKCAIMQGTAALDSAIINGFESTYDFEGQLPITLQGFAVMPASGALAESAP